MKDADFINTSSGFNCLDVGIGINCRWTKGTNFTADKFGKSCIVEIGDGD